MRPTQAFALITALLLPFAVAVPAQKARTVDDSDMVRTPAGLRPAGNVHVVPQGGSVKLVESEIYLSDSSGTVLHTATNNHSQIVPSAASATTSGAEAEESGWIAFAYWYNSEATAIIDSFTTSWEVPAVPAENHNQTVFLFNALQPVGSASILQPVLQFGPSAAGGGSYWGVASWFLVGNETFHSSVIEVATGDVLTGEITLTSSNGTSYDYVSSFTGIPGTTITATGSDVLVVAAETLEAYGITTATDYPVGSTSFHDINISVISGTPETVWSAVSDSADDLTASVTVDGFSNAEVVITYPQA